ncbi:MAG TPA: VOC family protein [Spirochaetota bacterium]|nr:VOC family protein [Spirochaetota bacterium]
MANHLHHVQIFASDIEKSIHFYQEMFGGRVVMDTEIAGARNVLMVIGNGRLIIYDQPPRDSGRGSIHHFAVQTDDIESNVERMKRKGIVFKKEITDNGYIKYIMVPAPDNILVEYFEVNKAMLSGEYAEFFE